MFCNKFHAVTERSQMHPNSTKRNETFNGVDWVCLLWKIPTRLHGTNFCINCTSSPRLHRVSCSYKMIPNAPKHYETHQNMSLGSNGVDQVHSLQKIQCDFMSRTFVLIEPVQYVLKQVSCSYGTIPNAPKYYEMHRNISLGSKRVDGVRLVVKNYNATSWHELLH